MNRKRTFVSLLTASSFLVLAVTGVWAFLRPFSVSVVGLHALTGFVFVGLIALHVINNAGHLTRYARSQTLWVTLAITVISTVVFYWQPPPIPNILRLSQNLGPALDRFEMKADEIAYEYSPAASYQMALSIRMGEAFDVDRPPHLAIWLENASFYHIKTLLRPEEPESGRAALPYWDFKVRGWEEAKRQSEETQITSADDLGTDAITGPTRNSSFDPADYILPPDSDIPMPYRLLIEIDQPDDGQPSLVYSVEIDNADPRAFQLLELMGYPMLEEDAVKDKETWELYYVDERFGSALELVDSALLTIQRELAP